MSDIAQILLCKKGGAATDYYGRKILSYSGTELINFPYLKLVGVEEKSHLEIDYLPHCCIILYADANAPKGGMGSKLRPFGDLEELRFAIRSIHNAGYRVIVRCTGEWTSWITDTRSMGNKIVLVEGLNFNAPDFDASSLYDMRSFSYRYSTINVKYFLARSVEDCIINVGVLSVANCINSKVICNAITFNFFSDLVDRELGVLGSSITIKGDYNRTDPYPFSMSGFSGGVWDSCTIEMYRAFHITKNTSENFSVWDSHVIRDATIVNTVCYMRNITDVDKIAVAPPTDGYYWANDSGYLYYKSPSTPSVYFDELFRMYDCKVYKSKILMGDAIKVNLPYKIGKHNADTSKLIRSTDSPDPEIDVSGFCDIIDTIFYDSELKYEPDQLKVAPNPKMPTPVLVGKGDEYNQPIWASPVSAPSMDGSLHLGTYGSSFIKCKINITLPAYQVGGDGSDGIITYIEPETGAEDIARPGNGTVVRDWDIYDAYIPNILGNPGKPITYTTKCWYGEIWELCERTEKGEKRNVPRPEIDGVPVGITPNPADIREGLDPETNHILAFTDDAVTASDCKITYKWEGGSASTTINHVAKIKQTTYQKALPKELQ